MCASKTARSGVARKCAVDTGVLRQSVVVKNRADSYAGNDLRGCARGGGTRAGRIGACPGLDLARYPRERQLSQLSIPDGGLKSR